MGDPFYPGVRPGFLLRNRFPPGREAVIVAPIWNKFDFLLTGRIVHSLRREENQTFAGDINSQRLLKVMREERDRRCPQSLASYSKKGWQKHA
jgi:hypothetical protein